MSEDFIDESEVVDAEETIQENIFIDEVSEIKIDESEIVKEIKNVCLTCRLKGTRACLSCIEFKS